MEAREMEEMLVEISRLLHRHLTELGADEEDGKDMVQDAIYKWLLYADYVRVHASDARTATGATTSLVSTVRERTGAGP